MQSKSFTEMKNYLLEVTTPKGELQPLALSSTIKAGANSVDSPSVVDTTSFEKLDEEHITRESGATARKLANHVFVIDTNKNPLDPCHPARARELLHKGKAAVFRRFPFTLILKREVASATPCVEVKIDPGSRTTGFALVKHGKVVWAAELKHRGIQIRGKLDSRRACRRNRRTRLRYRQPRFLNRTKPKGWLAPSLEHRVRTVMTWVRRFERFCPVTGFAQELVRFDTQLIQNPEISGVEYQRGTLHEAETREYLLEKWGRKCAYCGKENVPLEKEHIVPRSKGGSDRVSNLTIACVPCNQRKDNRPIEEFLKRKPDVLKRVLAHAKAPLRDAAAVNATRWALFQCLKDEGLPVRCGTGGRTKWNRKRFGWPKSHWLDAAAVSRMDELRLATTQPLLIECKGQGGRQKALVNKYGYPIQHRPLKPVRGWRSGDMAVFEGATYRVTPRASGSFALSRKGEKPFSRPQSRLRRVHRQDGYVYAL